jgi:hypothetical protein
MGELIHILRPVAITLAPDMTADFEAIDIKVIVKFNDQEKATVSVFEGGDSRHIVELVPGDTATINFENKINFW